MHISIYVRESGATVLQVTVPFPQTSQPESMPRSHYNVRTRAEAKLLGCKSITSSDSVRTFFSDKNHFDMFERIGNAFLPRKF